MGDVAVEHEQGRMDALGCPARLEVACGGAATTASDGDDSGSDNWAAPVVFVSAEVRRS